MHPPKPDNGSHLRTPALLIRFHVDNLIRVRAGLRGAELTSVRVASAWFVFD